MSRPRRFALQVRNHTEACILSVAVREYCQKQKDAYHYAALRASDEGRIEDAARLHRQYQDVYNCEWRTLARLRRIIDKFEEMIPQDQYEQGLAEDRVGSGGGYGYSLDNATCHN